MMKRKLKKILKRIGRIFLWILSGMILLVLLLYAVQKIFFPEPKILRIASDNVRKTTGRELRVRDLSWNLLGSLDVTGVELGYTEAEGRWEQPLFSVEKVAVRFKILPLLRRRMEVADISIDRPAVHVVPEMMKPGAFAAAGRAPSDSAAADTVVKQMQPLPVSFSLSRFRLSDFDLNLTLPDTLPLTKVAITGLCVELENLHVPRGFPEASEGIRADLKCFTRHSRIRIEGRDLKETYIPDLEMLAGSGRDNRWSLSLNLGLLREKDQSGGLKFGLEMNGAGPADSVHLGRLSVSAGAQTLMLATGDGVMEERVPRFLVDFTGDSVRVGELIRDVKPLIPDPFAGLTDSFLVDGTLLPLAGRAEGNPERIRFQVQSLLLGGIFSAAQNHVEAQGIHFGLHAQGSWTEADSLVARIKVTAGLDSLRMSPGDTLSLAFGNARMEIDAGLKGAGVPYQGTLAGGITDVFGGRADMHLQWETDPARPLERFSCDGSFGLDSLDLGSLPMPEKILSGFAHLAADMHLRGLQDIRLDLRGRSEPGLAMPDGTHDRMPEIRLDADLAMRADPLEQTAAISRALVRVNDAAEARMQAFLDLGKQVFRVSIPSMLIRHEALLRMLPFGIQSQLRPFKITGRDSLSVEVSGMLEKNAVKADVTGRLNVLDAAFEDLKQGFRIEPVTAALDLSGDLARFKGQGELRAGGIYLGPVRPEPLKDNRIWFSWALDEQSLSVDSMRFEMPDLAVTGSVHADVTRLKSAPEIHADAKIGFHSGRWVEAVTGVFLQGSTHGIFSMSATDPAGKPVNIAGTLIVDSLNVRQQELVSVRGIGGKIPIQAELDPVKAGLVPNARWKPRPGFLYESFREYYRGATREVDNFRIRRIEAAGYTVRDVSMDIRLAGGILEVPRFSLNLLEGNIGGSLWLNPGTGVPDSITYSIQCQASRINAAAMLAPGVKKKEETELNASLSFTGRGVDIKKGIDLDGYFYITQIGPKFASTLLKGMDAAGSDRNIRMTRRLLDAGWKPKLFSFELRHGYVYPSLSLSQPWFSPVRLPPRVEYGRLPLEFFMKNPGLMEK
jgi:hypothetical protein